MSFSVGTGPVPADELPQALLELVNKIPESQYARAEAIQLVTSAVAYLNGLFESGELGDKAFGGWSANVSGHSNPSHAPQDNYAADEFFSVSLNHHSPSSMEYYAKQNAK